LIKAGIKEWFPRKGINKMTEQDFLIAYHNREEWEQLFWFKWNMGPWKPIQANKIVCINNGEVFSNGVVFEMYPAGNQVTFEQLKTYGKLGDYIERPKDD